ncbi:MAG: hypothetical protein KGO21_01915 [Hyphomicrobiales bacterium]|nr:hypothetical protein [Hyphomicrobiales bacterium]
MSALKALNFVAVPKQVGYDPVQARRAKLITQLEQQRELAKDESFVVKRQKWVKQEDGSKALVERPKRVKRWWRMDASGNCFLILRYGNKLLSPTPDKGAIAVGDKSKLPEVVDTIIAAVRGGELDAAMAAAKAIDPARGVKKKAA